MSEENLEDGFFIKHDYCVASELKTAGVMKFGETPYEDCGSSDGNALYEHDLQDGSVTYSGFCWSCKQAFKPEQLAKTSLAKELNITEEGSVTERIAFERKEKTPALTKVEVKGLIKDLGYTDKVYRGIKPEYMKFFGHLTKEDRNGNITSVYYPETRNGDAWPTGYKIRHLPKYFSKIGQTGLKSDMAGYIKFKGYENHRTVLICAGEVDMVSAYQMLREQQLRKGQEDYAPIAVLSPTTGEGSAIKQIRQHYEFLCSFENIVLGFDNDDVGNKSMEEIADILPKDKVKVIKWTYGDPNKALMNGKDKQFLSDFYNAKEFNDNGIFASHGLMPYIKEALLLPRVTLPSYMQRLQDMCKPSLIKNRIYNIIGITSCGKCLAEDTPIMMHDGSIKSVQDVVVGDLVMGADGSPRKVLNTTSGEDTMYRIDQVEGDSYTVNSEHILSLRAGYTIDKKSSVRLTKGEVVNVKVTDYINFPANAKRSLKGYKGSFEALDDGVSIKHPWLVGMWLGDGHSDQATITQGVKATRCIENIYKIAEDYDYTISVAPSRDRDCSKGFCIGNGFRTYLNENNLIKNKHIPMKWKTASTEDRLALLGGLIDSDGYLHEGRGYEITQKSEVLANDITFLAKSLGFKCSNRKVYKTCQTGNGGWYYRMYISGRVDKLSKYLVLDYKKIPEGFLSTLREDQNTAITVTEVGKGKYYGFELDKDHLFCLGDFTVTHNSTHVNNIVHHLAFLPNEKTAVVSLEATKGEYGIDLLSLHLETNLYWKESDNVIEYLESPDVIEKANDLFVNEDGESRFYVVDDRKGTVDSLEKLCETLRNKYGVTVIVIDVLTDLLRVTSNEEQAKHMNWQSNFVKSGVTIINVLHTRKLDPNKDGTPKKCTEYDAYGSSIFVQKAAGNIVINRSKECPHDDWIERNSTYVDVPKMRQGETGEAGVWLYDPETRQVYDREKFFKTNPEKLPLGYDLSISSFDKAYWEEGGRGWDGVSNNKGGFTKKAAKVEKVEKDWEIDVGDGTKF